MSWEESKEKEEESKELQLRKIFLALAHRCEETVTNLMIQIGPNQDADVCMQLDRGAAERPFFKTLQFYLGGGRRELSLKSNALMGQCLNSLSFHMTPNERECFIEVMNRDLKEPVAAEITPAKTVHRQKSSVEKGQIEMILFKFPPAEQRAILDTLIPELEALAEKNDIKWHIKKHENLEYAAAIVPDEWRARLAQRVKIAQRQRTAIAEMKIILVGLEPAEQLILWDTLNNELVRHATKDTTRRIHAHKPEIARAAQAGGGRST